MNRLEANSDGIARIAERLRGGEVCAVPSETVYGLAANALDESAVARIFEIKGRPHSDPLIVHIASMEMLAQVVSSPPATLEPLARAFWPGPMTLILHKQPVVSDLITAGLPTVAVRMPAHPALRRLIQECGFPLAAPSANPFGYVSPTRAEHVALSLGDKIDWILDGGECEHGIESTIINLCQTPPVILRQGPIQPEMIEAVIGIFPGVVSSAPATTATPQLSPGTLPRHYSPLTPMQLVSQPQLSQADDPRTAVVFWAKPSYSCPANVHWLTATGDMAEAARNLFDVLRSLDSANYSTLVFQMAPDEGLGRAINDRLKRAATRT